MFDYKITGKSCTRLIVLISALLTYGCATNELELAKSKHNVSKTKITFKKNTPIYIKIHKKINKKIKRKVSISAVNIPLISAITYIDSSFSIEPDTDVDLAQLINVKFHNKTIEEYFHYLSQISNYNIKSLGNGVVKISSFQEKTWNLQTLSMAQVKLKTKDDDDDDDDGGDDDGGDGDGDDGASSWDSVLVNLENILGSDAHVLTNKQMGTITAFAIPSKIKLADRWLSELIVSSNKQIHLNVQILDVSVDESVGNGIDWNLVLKNSSPFAIENRSAQSIDGAGSLTFKSLATNPLKLGKNITFDFMLKLLRKQGKVRTENQPNITITNGRTAFISTGDAFSYVSSVNVIAGDADTPRIIETEVARTEVGITMQVTPKILEDSRIVISIVPIISSLKSFTQLGSEIDGTLFKTPNIALQSLATQVIVNSGETIHLGGLIAEKIANSAKNLPKGSLLGIFFDGEIKKLERREIVILITPTIV